MVTRCGRPTSSGVLSTTFRAVAHGCVSSAPDHDEILRQAVEKGDRGLGESTSELVATGFMAGFTVVFGIIAQGSSTRWSTRGSARLCGRRRTGARCCPRLLGRRRGRTVLRDLLRFGGQHQRGPHPGRFLSLLRLWARRSFSACSMASSSRSCRPATALCRLARSRRCLCRRQGAGKVAREAAGEAPGGTVGKHRRRRRTHLASVLPAGGRRRHREPHRRRQRRRGRAGGRLPRTRCRDDSPPRVRGAFGAAVGVESLAAVAAVATARNLVGLTLVLTAHVRALATGNDG